MDLQAVSKRLSEQEMGLDPQPEFKRVAKLSSREIPRGNTTSTAVVLSRFHTYAVVKERRKTGGRYRGDDS